MGWLYSERWPTRKDLIDHITTQTPTLKHCCTGNNLWCVHEVKGIRFVCLYLMQFHGGSFKYWGVQGRRREHRSALLQLPTIVSRGLN